MGQTCLCYLMRLMTWTRGECHKGLVARPYKAKGGGETSIRRLRYSWTLEARWMDVNDFVLLLNC